jgi:hypothetical protein
MANVRSRASVVTGDHSPLPLRGASRPEIQTQNGPRPASPAHFHRPEDNGGLVTCLSTLCRAFPVIELALACQELEAADPGSILSLRGIRASCPPPPTGQPTGRLYPLARIALCR